MFRQSFVSSILSSRLSAFSAQTLTQLADAFVSLQRLGGLAKLTELRYFVNSNYISYISAT
jgi:hypothetical protein